MSKPNLLLLHGALGSAAQFDELKSILDHRFQVHVLSFDGHGGKPCDGPFTLSRFVHNVLDYILEQRLKGCGVFGYSMGGYVALSLAKDHPGQISRIMTLGTKFDWTPESASAEVKMLDPEKIEAKVPAFAQVLKARHAPVDWKEVLEKTAAMMLSLGNGIALTHEDLGKVSMPVLIGIGSDDKMVSREESARAAESLPNGRLQIINECQHPIEKVDPEVLSSIIKDFFS